MGFIRILCFIIFALLVVVDGKGSNLITYRAKRYGSYYSSTYFSYSGGRGYARYSRVYKNNNNLYPSLYSYMFKWFQTEDFKVYKNTPNGYESYALIGRNKVHLDVTFHGESREPVRQRSTGYLFTESDLPLIVFHKIDLKLRPSELGTRKWTHISVCSNYEADVNGTYLGIFTCPLPFVPESHSYCCGLPDAQYCCKFWDIPLNIAAASLVISMGVLLVILFIHVVIQLCINRSKEKREQEQLTSLRRIGMLRKLGRQPSMKSFALWTFFEKIHSESEFREGSTHTENDEDSDTEISEPKSEIETTSTYMEKNDSNITNSSFLKSGAMKDEITGNNIDTFREMHKFTTCIENCTMPSNMAASKMTNCYSTNMAASGSTLSESSNMASSKMTMSYPSNMASSKQTQSENGHCNRAFSDESIVACRRKTNNNLYALHKLKPIQKLPRVNFNLELDGDEPTSYVLE